MEVGHVLPEVEMEAIRIHADPEALRAAFLEVANHAFDLFFEKGGDYDKQLPYWHRHPFGDASYGHETFKKSGRAVSIVLKGGETRFEDLDEQIDDIINYAIMWRHWRSITGRSIGRTPRLDDIVSLAKEIDIPQPPPLTRPQR